MKVETTLDELDRLESTHFDQGPHIDQFALVNVMSAIVVFPQISTKEQPLVEEAPKWKGGRRTALILAHDNRGDTTHSPVSKARELNHTPSQTYVHTTKSNSLSRIGSENQVLRQEVELTLQNSITHPSIPTAGSQKWSKSRPKGLPKPGPRASIAIGTDGISF